MKIDNRFLWGSNLTQHIAKETEDMQMYYEGRLNLYRTILHMMEKDEKALEYIVSHDRYSLSVAGAIPKWRKRNSLERTVDCTSAYI